MKKIKVSILSLAIVFSICAAFVTKPHFDCTVWPQYWYNGTQYIPVSTTYGCLQQTTTCTYYSTNGGLTFAPCTVGSYDNCLGCAVTPQSQPAR